MWNERYKDAQMHDFGQHREGRVNGLNIAIKYDNRRRNASRFSVFSKAVVSSFCAGMLLLGCLFALLHESELSFENSDTGERNASSRNPGIVVLEYSHLWYNTSSSVVTSMCVSDIDADGTKELVTGGYYDDLSRNNAQLGIWAWNGASLSSERLHSWYSTSNTYVNAVCAYDIDADGIVEAITGGSYYDGTYSNAQLRAWTWNGATLTMEAAYNWNTSSDTYINSLAFADVDSDGQVEIITGGYCGDKGEIGVFHLSGAFINEKMHSWQNVSTTSVFSVCAEDVDGDSTVEIISGGYYHDGVRECAQVCVWRWLSGAFDAETYYSWYTTSTTYVFSVTAYDVDKDSAIELVTGGLHYDNTRNRAQIRVLRWSGLAMTPEYLYAWYTTGDTRSSSVACFDVDADSVPEIVSGGSNFDGSRNNAQLGFFTWSGSSFASKELNSWYNVSDTEIRSLAISDINSDGAIEVVTGGDANDGARLEAQITIWRGPTAIPEFGELIMPIGCAVISLAVMGRARAKRAYLRRDYRS